MYFNTSRDYTNLYTCDRT